MVQEEIGIFRGAQMHRRKIALSTLGASFGILVSAVSVTPASALDFTFEFSNTIGSVSGSINGRILGLADNATSSATGIFIDTAPGALGFSQFPLDVLTTYNQISANSFTVQGGIITNAEVYANTSGNPPWFWLNHFNYNFIDSPNNNTINVTNDNGFAGITFNSAPVPGPLPVFGAAIGFGFSRKIRRRISKSAINSNS